MAPPSPPLPLWPGLPLASPARNPVKVEEVTDRLPAAKMAPPSPPLPPLLRASPAGYAVMEEEVTDTPPVGQKWHRHHRHFRDCRWRSCLACGNGGGGHRYTAAVTCINGATITTGESSWGPGHSPVSGCRLPACNCPLPKRSCQGAVHR